MKPAAELHRAMFAAIQDRDPEALRELFAPEAIHTSGDGRPMTGPDPVIREVRSFVEAFPDLTIEVRHHHLVDSSRSIIEYTFSGTHEGHLEDLPPTGKSVAVVACSVLEADNGAITREADYFDTVAMLAQLGMDGG